MFDYPFHARSKFSPSDALPVINHLGHSVGVATSAKRACELLANHGLANARTCMRKVSGTTVFADVRCTDKPMFVYGWQGKQGRWPHRSALGFTPYGFAVCGDLNTAARLGVLELTDRAQSQSPNLLDAF